MYIIVIALALLSGCINVEWEIQQPNPAVKRVLSGGDCVNSFFGIGGGTVTFANAMRQGIHLDLNHEWTGYAQIRNIHSARISQEAFLIFGTYCLRVTGEP